MPIRFQNYFEFVPVINDFFGAQRRFFHYPTYSHNSRHHQRHSGPYAIGNDSSGRSSAVVPPPPPEDMTGSIFSNGVASNRSRFSVEPQLDPRLRYNYHLQPYHHAFHQYPDTEQLASLRSWDPLEYRRAVYQHNLRPRPSDPSLPIRMVNANFFSSNEAQLHRLGPFLDRELHALLPDLSSSQRGNIMTHILHLLARYEILSTQFRAVLSIYMGSPRANHFSDELYSFARSHHQLLHQYDGSVIYERRSDESLPPPFELDRPSEELDRQEMRRAFEIMNGGNGDAGVIDPLRGSLSSLLPPNSMSQGTTASNRRVVPRDVAPDRQCTIPPFFMPQQSGTSSGPAARDSSELNPDMDFNFMTGGSLDNATNLTLDPAMLDLNTASSWRGPPPPSDRPLSTHCERPRTPTISLSSFLSDSPLRNQLHPTPMPGRKN